MDDSKKKIVDALCAAIEPLFPPPAQGVGADGNTESAPRVPRATRDNLVMAVHLLFTACGGHGEPKPPIRKPICDPKAAPPPDLKPEPKLVPLFPVGSYPSGESKLPPLPEPKRKNK